MDAASGDAFGFPVEAVFDGGVGIDMERLQGLDAIPIGERDGRDGFDEVSEGQFIARLPFRQWVDAAFADVGALSVEAGGEEEK